MKIMKWVASMKEGEAYSKKQAIIGDEQHPFLKDWAAVDKQMKP